MDIITYALAHKAKVALESPKDGVPGKVLISDGQGGTTWGEHINILVVKASDNSAFNSTADTITVTSIKDNKGKTWDKSSTHIGDTVYVEEQKLPDRWISKIDGSTIYLAKLETIQVPVVGVTVNDTSVVDTSTGIANIVVDNTLKAGSSNPIDNNAVYVETQAIRAYATKAISDEFTRAATNENKIEGLLNTEVSRAKTAEEANTASINSEVANRKVADTTLQQNIDAEKTRATAVENAINQNLAQSVTNLSQIDAALQVNIANEKIRAEGAESTLQSNIDNEASLRSAADGVLQQNITAAISTAADDATTKATAAETNAKSYTDTRIGDIGDNTNVKAYVDGKIGFLADNLDPDAIDSIKEVVDLVQGDGVIGQININKTDIAKITYAHEPELSEDKKMFFANGCPVKIINKGAELYAQYMIDNAAVANNSTGPINYKEMKITGVSHIYAGGNGKDKNVYYPATMLIIDVNTTEYTTKTSGDYAFTRVCGGCLGSGTVGSATVIVENGSFKGLYAGSSKELSTGANVSYDDACFTGEAKVVVNGGLINVLAANMDTTSTGHATYEINAGTVKWLYSAGANGMTGVVDVIINGGTVNNALSVVRGTSEEANWTVNGGSVATLYMSSDNDSSDWGNIKKVTLKALGGTITTLDKGGAANPVRSGSYKEGVITNLTSELATACNLTKIVDTDTTYEGSDSIEITGDNNSISIKDGGVIEDKLSQEVKDKLNAACAEYTVIKADDTSTKPTANIYQLTKDDVQVGVDVKDTLYYDDNLTTRIIGNNQVQVQTTDDAARSQWGGGWRIPTYAELDELWAKSWNFTADDSVGSGGRPGYVTISGNGNSIKLPTTTKRGVADSDVFWYTSSDLYDSDSRQFKTKSAYCALWGGSTTAFNKYPSSGWRKDATYIRPVLDKGADANGHIAVDIGLSVLWADRNLGADDFKGIGYKIAWGETEPKDEYTFENYKYADTINGSSEEAASFKYTKYVRESTYGTVDGLTRLDQGTFYSKIEVDRLLTSKIGNDKFVTTDTTQTISGEKTFTKNLFVVGTDGKSDSVGAIRVDNAKDMILSAGNAIYLRKTNEATEQDDGLIVNFATDTVVPERDKILSIGASDKQFKNVYGEAIYQNGKQVQDKLTAGDNITIENNVITAKDTTYTGDATGTISISADNKISVNTDKIYTVTIDID